MKSLALLGLLAGLAAAGTAQAAVTATQGFSDTGTPLADGSASGDINTATTFTIGDLVSTSANTGDLAGMPSQNFGPVTFSLGSATSLTFSNAVFGTFASTSIVEATNVPGAVGFYVLGTYTPGTFSGGTGGPSSFTITFNQTPAHEGSISDSATFAIPPAPPPGTPEPSTWAMMIIGFAGLGYAGFRASKKKSAALAA
jgi:hypothetical protein